MPPHGSFPVTVNAPVEIVWPWVATLEKHVEWSPKPYTIEWISGEPNMVGSRYRSGGSIPGDKHHHNEGEVTDRIDHERFALRADDRDGPFMNTFTLRSTDDSTEVTFEMAFPRMRGIRYVLAPIVFRTVGSADIRRRMQLLKQRVEGSS
jgi:uncharacterized protein YndB with AHSA1/START domain